MAIQWQQTFWRGIRIDHPSQWELMQANRRGDPGRCLFADRRYQRLSVQWRPLKYKPNLELMLQKHLRKLGPDVEPHDLSGAPEPWKGLTRKAPEGVVVHAGRFFQSTRMLVEVTLVWPGERNAEIENTILSGMETPPPTGSARLWRAMGICASLPTEMDLLDSETLVGHIRWQFGPDTARSKPNLSVDRLALPEFWLDGSLADWLEKQLADSHEDLRVLQTRRTDYNGHSAQELLSSHKISPLASLRSIRRVQLDLAWLCHRENRVYRISTWKDGRDEHLAWPEGFSVTCCKPILSPAASRGLL